MARAVICPVCGGKGAIEESEPYTTTSPYKRTCHGCGGRGWVEVGD